MGDQNTPLSTTRSSLVDMVPSIQNEGFPWSSFDIKAVYGIHLFLWMYVYHFESQASWDSYGVFPPVVALRAQLTSQGNRAFAAIVMESLYVASTESGI